MARKKSIERGEKVGLKLTKAERTLLLKRLVLIPTEVEEVIDSTPPGKAVMISLNDLDDLAGHVAAEANHTQDKKVQKTLDRISQKIEDLLDRYIDEAEPPVGTVRLVEHVAQPLAENVPTTPPRPSRSKKGDEQYPLKLTDKEREAIIHATRLRRGLKDRNDDLHDALDEDKLAKPISIPARKADRIYRLMVTLKDVSPSIWRRVEVPDCTLGDLHEVIQTVMGWKDGHSHQWIGDEFDPDLFDRENVNRDLRRIWSVLYPPEIPS